MFSNLFFTMIAQLFDNSEFYKNKEPDNDMFPTGLNGTKRYDNYENMYL